MTDQNHTEAPEAAALPGLQLDPNPLMLPTKNPVVDLTTIPDVTIHKRKLRTNRREIRDIRRAKTAKEAIAGLDMEMEIFGFTKGQFSIVDLITAVLDITGPADQLSISTWTAANTDVTTVLSFVESGLVKHARWLVDMTFQRRSPQLAQRIRDAFGADAIRVAQNHAKFTMIAAGKWRVVIRTSMNLNFNPRFEDFTLAHDPELYEFMSKILDRIWKLQTKEQADAKPYEIVKHFLDAL